MHIFTHHNNVLLWYVVGLATDLLVIWWGYNGGITWGGIMWPTGVRWFAPTRNGGGASVVCFVWSKSAQAARAMQPMIFFINGGLNMNEIPAMLVATLPRKRTLASQAEEHWLLLKGEKLRYCHRNAGFVSGFIRIAGAPSFFAWSSYDHHHFSFVKLQSWSLPVYPMPGQTHNCFWGLRVGRL